MAAIIIFKVVGKVPYGSNLAHVNVGSTDHLAQRNLHIPEHVSHQIASSYLFEHSIPEMQAS
eukprot:scaffold223770_cov16-Tisochrysis_lutea.AAC.1